MSHIPFSYFVSYSLFIFRLISNLIFPSVGMVEDTRLTAAFSRLLPLPLGKVADDPAGNNAAGNAAGNNAGGNAGGGGIGEVGQASERRVGVAPLDWLPGGRGDATRST